jgi:hypothetical protein
LALRNVLPLGGIGVLAGVAFYFLFRPKHEDPNALERERRTYLNRVGRIVEGQIVEIVEEAAALGRKTILEGRAVPHGVLAVATEPSAQLVATQSSVGSAPKTVRSTGMFSKRALETDGSDSKQRLLYYTYSISGVTYETAQDVTGMEERLHLHRVAAGQVASVKYDPSNPSNSILLADDWSGLH